MTFIAFMIDQLGFHNCEKRFSHRIIPTISLARHTLNKSMAFEFISKARARILHATIRMKNKAVSGMSTLDRPLQRHNHHFMAQRAAQRPADHHTGEHIDDHCQVQPTGSGRQIRDIRYPHPVRSLRRKVSFKQIRCHREFMFAIGGHLIFTSNLGTQPGLAHSLGHTVFTHLTAPISKLLGDLRAAVAPLALLIDFANLSIQSLIIKLASTRLAFQPSVISTARHLKDSAHLQYTPNRAVLAYEPEYRCGSVEKMATAFFKISRSRRSRSFSRLSRRISSSSGFKRPLPTNACAPESLSSRFQRERTPWPIPSRLSTDALVIPGSAAIRTASTLNSKSYFLGIDTPPISFYHICSSVCLLIWGRFRVLADVTEVTINDF